MYESNFAACVVLFDLLVMTDVISASSFSEVVCTTVERGTSVDEAMTVVFEPLKSSEQILELQKDYCKDSLESAELAFFACL